MMKPAGPETAYSDLLEIGRAIAKDSPSRARSFVDELYERCKGLSTMARVLRVLHGARDYERLLFPDE